MWSLPIGLTAYQMALPLADHLDASPAACVEQCGFNGVLVAG